MSINKVRRRENMISAIAMAGSAAALAKSIGVPTADLNQFKSKAKFGKQPLAANAIDDRLARKIEDALDLGVGWMDKHPNANVNSLRTIRSEHKNKPDNRLLLGGRLSWAMEAKSNRDRVTIRKADLARIAEVSQQKTARIPSL